ncbi:MAG: hypothetical protein C0596_01745 [Marinilabiliales bacterium]|nr:MAG: hypothetical protein C0596_01745 [Marinilabiliales bacterium]
MKYLISLTFVLISLLGFGQLEVNSSGLNSNYSDGTPVLIPGTNIMMTPPEHFLVSESIPGLIHPGYSTTVQVQEVVGTSYVMIKQAMTPEHFESQNVTLISEEDIKMSNGMGGVLYLVEFTVKGYQYERLMLFAGDYNNTIWINANYPKSTKALLYDLLVESLLTAHYIK